jgi:hypothetical protein
MFDGEIVRSLALKRNREVVGQCHLRVPLEVEPIVHRPLRRLKRKRVAGWSGVDCWGDEKKTYEGDDGGKDAHDGEGRAANKGLPWSEGSTKMLHESG